MEKKSSSKWNKKVVLKKKKASFVLQVMNVINFLSSFYLCSTQFYLWVGGS